MPAFGQGTSGDLRHQQRRGEDQQRMLIGPVEDSGATIAQNRPPSTPPTDMAR